MPSPLPAQPLVPRRLLEVRLRARSIGSSSWAVKHFATPAAPADGERRGWPEKFAADR